MSAEDTEEIPVLDNFENESGDEVVTEAHPIEAVSSEGYTDEHLGGLETEQITYFFALDSSVWFFTFPQMSLLLGRFWA